jgi:hypothetical protein
MTRRSILAGALFLAAGPALAEPPGRLPTRECTCRAPGRVVHVGERLCLATPEGPRMALCTMNQNVTSWSFTREGCVVSAVLP